MRAQIRGKELLPALAAAALLCAACAVMAARFGLCLPPAALALAVLGVWLPGRVLAEAVGARRLGLAQTAAWTFGLALFAVCAALGSATGWHALPWTPAALGVAGAALLWERRRGLCPPAPGRGTAWLCAGALALMAFYCFVCAPHFARASVAAGGAVLPEHDFLWNVGNAKSFLLSFPPQDLRFSGYTLTYHYLSELLCAGLAMAAGADCYDVQGALLPLLGIAFTVSALWELGGVLYKGSRKRSAALLALTFLFGSAGLWTETARGDRFLNLSGYHLLTNINGMGFALGLAAAFFAAAAALFAAGEAGPEKSAERPSFAARADGVRASASAETPPQCAPARPAWLWALGSAAFALLCVAKGPIAGVAVLALLCAALARLLFARDVRRTAPMLVWALALLAVFGAVYGVLFSAGAGTSVALRPLGTLRETYFSTLLARAEAAAPRALWLVGPLLALATAVCYAPAAVPLALAGGVADVRRIARLPGGQLMLYAGFLGGFLAFFLFWHESASQMYFGFLGLLCANALAVRHAGELARRRNARGSRWRRAAAALALVGLATTAFSAAALWRSAAPVYAGLPCEDGVHLPLTAEEEQAMAWLAENTPADALCATNRAHTGKALEGLSNAYSGLSGRRFYMESFKYARTNLGVPEAELIRRVEEMQALFGDAISPAEAAALCREDGIDYVIYSRAAARRAWDITEHPAAGLFAKSAAPEGFALAFENHDVAIYRVLP